MNSAPNSEQLARLRELVTRDPEIMGGTPVFKGTGIPMDLVADMLAKARPPTRFSNDILR